MKKNMVKIEYLNAQVSSKICMFQMVVNIMFSTSGYTNRSTAGSVNKPCDRIRCKRRADVRSHFDG